MSCERDAFEQRFDTTEKEILVLTEQGASASPFVESSGTKEIERGRYFWVKEVLERNCSEKRLNKLLEKYQEPVIISLKNGEKLLLDKSIGIFSGEGSWNGESCRIHLDMDEQDTATLDDAVTADDARETFYKLLENGKEWDDKARKYAAEELTETANEWLEDDAEEITKEEFAKRLGISEVSVSTDGYFEIFYEDDDMFGGHVVIVSGNIENGIEDANMAG